MLTLFGKFLVELSKLHYSPDARSILRRASKLLGCKYVKADEYHSLINGKRVIILGSGLANDNMRSYVQAAKADGALLLGTAWSSLIYKDIDILLSGHAAHMISGVICEQSPSRLLQAVTFPTPRVFKNVAQVQRIHLNKYSYSEILAFVEEYKTSKNEVHAKVFSLSSTLFIGIFFALMHNAKEIELIGFDPMNPEYGLTEESMKLLLKNLIPENGVCLDPYLGSNNQTPKEAIERIHATLSSGSSRCVENLEPLKEKMSLMLQILSHFNVSISAVGKSDFMDSIAGMKRVHLN